MEMKEPAAPRSISQEAEVRKTPINHREAFTATAIEMGHVIGAHLKSIEAAMQRAIAQTPSLKNCYQRSWKKRLDRVFLDLARFERNLLLRPSLCVMGRRGAGKTTLLRSWLGASKKQKGLSLKALPCGYEDTTACLVRLTAQHGKEHPNTIMVSLLDEKCMNDVTPRPPRPDRDFFRVKRDEDNHVFYLARFPVCGEGGDDIRTLQETDDGCFVLDETGGGNIRFEDIQWNAREICIPVDIQSEDRGWAGQVLSEVDIVDSPGADSTKQGEFGDWKKGKNVEVFQVAANELDMLLLAASAQPSSINIGGQFQEDVMYPWSRRCGSKSDGRLLIILTHASELLKNPMRILEDDLEDSAENNSFGRMLYKNILLPLFVTAPDGTPPIVRQDDIATWPLVFFYDKDAFLLEKFRGSIPPGGALAATERLCSFLDRNPLDTDLSDAEKCILLLVKDCDDIRYENPQADILSFKKWLIRSLCAFLDPADTGLGLLTHYVVQYASFGPVAIAHAQEREALLENVLTCYKSFLEGFSLSRANFQAEEEILRASKLVRKVLGKGRYDQKMRFGGNCRKLLKAASQNIGIETQRNSRYIYDSSEVVSAAVTDALALDKRWGQAGEEDKKALTATLRQCLLNTPAIARLFDVQMGVFTENRDVLHSLLAYVMERLPGIVDFLKDIDEETRSTLAKEYFEADPDEMELLREIYATRLSEEDEAVAPLFEKARAECAAYLKELEENPVVFPFQNKTPVKEDVQS